MENTTTNQIGATATAELIANYHHGLVDWLPNGVDFVDSGSHRAVYVDHDTDVVYKVGLDSVNRREVSVLNRLRTAGADYAPPATLHHVTISATDPCDGDQQVTVVAMPYLPDDGSLPRPYPLFPGACDLNPANVVAHKGQHWLIDAGGL